MKQIINSLKDSKMQQFIRFAIVGISGTVVDFGILFLLTSTGWQTVPANIVSYSAGIVNNYIWNSRWTFKESDQSKRFQQFLQFTFVSLIGMGLNSLIVVSLESFFVALGISSTLSLLGAKVIATGIILIWNFIANSLWTFRSTEKKEKENGENK